MEPILPTSSSADSSSSRTSPISLAVAASAQMSSKASSSEVAASSSTATSTSQTTSTPSNNTTASLFPSTTTMGGGGTSLTPSMSSLLTHGDSKPSLLSSTRSLSSSGSSILPTRSTLSGAASSSLLSGSTSSLLPTSSTSGTTNNNSSTQSSENLPPRTLARVARDVRDLVKKPPEGIRLVLDDETGMPGSLSEIMAEIEGPEQTPYHTRYFQLKLVLSTDFPATPPRGYFLTKIYHPNVDPTSGAICVNTLKKDWTSSTSLSHVLTVIRCLLIVPFPESSLNDEAGKNFMDSYDEYARRAKLLANVHGLTSWSSAKTEWNSNGSGNGSGSIGEGKTPEGEESPEQDDKKKAATDNGLPNGSSGGGGGGLSKKTSRSNIVRAGSKTLDKKSKKKSLRRL